MIIRKPRLSTLLYFTHTKHDSHSVKCYIAHFKYLQIHNGSKTIAMDTLDYTRHISATIGSNDMIEEPLESQDQLLYLTPPTLNIILTLSSTTLQPLQNCQTLQRFLSPLYIDGHEREDVMAYRCAFVEQWKTYELRFHQWDNDGHELPRPNGFPVPDGLLFRLVLVTHDESTFYQNDHCKIVCVGSEDQLLRFY